jgi:hypothetical protein
MIKVELKVEVNLEAKKGDNKTRSLENIIFFLEHESYN